MRTTRPDNCFISLAIAAACASALPVHAAEYTDSVPLPLVKALMAGPLGDEVHLYSDIPGDFPDIPVPANFSVLGGIEQMNSSRVILQTSDNREDAIAALSDALLSAGFVEMQTMGGGRPGGFTSSGVMMLPRNFCRDDIGFLTTMVSQQAGLTQVSLGTSRAMFDSGASSCAEVQAQMRNPNPNGPGIPVTNLAQYMPEMVLPDASNNTPQPFLAISGGSSSRTWVSGGATYETSSEFSSDMNIPQLYQHLAQQIGTQGWALDSEGSGQLSASGNWIKIPDADTYLHGAFNILQSSESNFMIRFRLTRLSVEQ